MDGRDLLDLSDRLDPGAPRARKGPQATLGQLGLKDRADPLESPGQLDPKDLKEGRVTLDHWCV